MTTVVENEAQAQRDTSSTYFVDVTFGLYDTTGAPVVLTFEWRRGTTAPWQTANPQSGDFRHTATTPQAGLPVISPGTSLHFTWNAFFDLTEGTFTDLHFRITATGSSVAQVVLGPFSATTEIRTQEQNVTRSQARRGLIDRAPDDFLGQTVVAPLRRGASDFVSARGVELIRAAVAQILGTRASVGQRMGELDWRPDFGSKLWVLKHRRNDPTLEAQADAFAREALLQEPRVEVLEVTVEPEPSRGPNDLVIRVRYQVITEDVEANLVILPEFEEMVQVA